VVAVQKGHETAKKGMNITIQYEITNNRTETVIMFYLTVRTLNMVLELLNLEKPKNTPVLYIYTN